MKTWIQLPVTDHEKTILIIYKATWILKYNPSDILQVKRWWSTQISFSNYIRKKKNQ